MGPDPSSTGEYSTLDAMPDTSSRAPAPSLPLPPVAPLPPGSAVTAAKPIFGDGKPSTRHGARAKGTLTPWPPPRATPARRLAPAHAPPLVPGPRQRSADPRHPGVGTVQSLRPPTWGRPPGAAAGACFLFCRFFLISSRLLITWSLSVALMISSLQARWVSTVVIPRRVGMTWPLKTRRERHLTTASCRPDSVVAWMPFLLFRCSCRKPRKQSPLK